MPVAVDRQSGKAVYLADDGSWQEAPTAIHPQTRDMVIFDGRTWVPSTPSEASPGQAPVGATGGAPESPPPSPGPRPGAGVLERVGGFLSDVWNDPPPTGPSVIRALKEAGKAITDPVPAATASFGETGEGATPTNPMIKRGVDIATTASPISAGSALRRAPAAAMEAAPSAVPTVAELKAAATKGYESPQVAAVEINAQPLQNWAQKLKGDLTEKGLDENTATKTWGILSKLEKAPADSFVTAKNIDSLRKTFSEAAGSIDRSERKAAVAAMDSLDDLLPSIAAKDVRAGNPAEASAILDEARANWSAARHAETIDKKQFRAELRSAAANSGQNVSNTMRQRIADILVSDKELRGFTTEEQALMRQIVEGTPAQNTLRGVGNFLGGGGGLGALASAGVGAAATGGPGVIAPLIGYGLKKLGNWLTARDVSKLNEMVRSNSPLGKQMKATLDAWSRAALAHERATSPRTTASMAITTRNLATNLRDAGIELGQPQPANAGQ